MQTEHSHMYKWVTSESNIQQVCNKEKLFPTSFLSNSGICRVHKGTGIPSRLVVCGDGGVLEKPFHHQLGDGKDTLVQSLEA